MIIRPVLAFVALTLLPVQDAEELRRAVGDVPLVGPWIYDDVPAGFAEAKRTGKPLAVIFRCVP